MRDSRVRRAFGGVALALALVAGCTGADGTNGSVGAPGPAGPKGGLGPGGPQGPAGDKGVKGDSATNDPSVSAVFPSAAYLGRTLDVTISGYGTAFGDGTTVDFGADVTVNSVTVASPTALVANVTVGEVAKPGPLDVTVKSGAKDLLYRGGFKLLAPIGVKLSGAVAQGGIALFEVKNLDVATPFDATTDGNPFAPTYTNVSIAAPAGVATEVLSVEPYALSFAAFVDLDAATGPADVVLESGPAGEQSSFAYPAAYTVEKAAPVAFAGDTAALSIAAPFTSALATYVPPAGTNVVDVGVSADDMSATPRAWILPKSGHFADVLAVAAPSALVITTSQDPLHFVYFDSAGTVGGAALHAKATALVTGTETEPNDDVAGACTTGALPYLVGGASLASDADADVFAVTVDANAVGKKLAAYTLPGDSATDTVVELLDTDGTTSLGLSDDLGYLDATTATIAAAGTYFVRVTASPYFDPSHAAYRLLLRLE